MITASKTHYNQKKNQNISSVRSPNEEPQRRARNLTETKQSRAQLLPNMDFKEPFLVYEEAMATSHNSSLLQVFGT